MINIQEPAAYPETTSPELNAVVEQKSKKSPKWNYIIGGVLLLLLIVGGGAGYWLTQQSQDIRQQASQEKYTVGTTGYNYDTGEWLIPGTAAWNTAIANKNQIAGAYYGDNGKLYMIGGTEAGWVKFATEHYDDPSVINALNLSFYNPSDGNDTSQRIITPRIKCGGTGYNQANCSQGSTSIVYNGITLNGTWINGYFYINSDALVALNNAGLTWVPTGTGCGDKTNDSIDCNTWHFTSCLHQGSGINGQGCDVAPPNDNPDPSPIPTPTPTPSPTPTPTPTPPVGPQCLDITMDSPEAELGDSSTFTCGAVTGADHYVFRIMTPDGIISNLEATGRISAAYVFDQSGLHYVQCQICTSADESSCHPWETLP